MNPCQFSPEVIDVLRGLIELEETVHDPFAGHGLRLGALCDELQIQASFSGGDIEVWEPRDRRVYKLDALKQSSYPAVRPFTIVTSPVYQNKRCADYKNGPTPNTKVKGRRDYGIALGRALDDRNLARTTGRPSRAADYWALHGAAVLHWDHRVLINVDLPISDPWQRLLVDRGYRIDRVIPAYTRRYRGLDNADLRAEHEVVIEASR